MANTKTRVYVCRGCEGEFECGSRGKAREWCDGCVPHVRKTPSGIPCAHCGEPTWVKDKDVAYHKRCSPFARGCGSLRMYLAGCRCDDCRAARNEVARAYAAKVKATTGISPTQKSRRLNPRTYRKFERDCEHCTLRFETITSTTRFCSRSCAKRNAAGWATTAEVEVYVAPEVAPHTDLPPGHPARQQPVKDWWSGFVAGRCDRCGDGFVTPTTRPELGGRFCSPRCRAGHHKAIRRARKRDAYVADVSPRKVFDRDGWRCQLCGYAVNRKAKVPHPKAPVVDHIVPLAAGGTHEPANAQCAHFLCNSIKSDRAANDQLRLFG